MFTTVNYYVTVNHNKDLGKTKMENLFTKETMIRLGMTVGIEIETVRESNENVLNHLRNEITDIEFNDV